MTHAPLTPGSQRQVLVAIGIVALLYGVGLLGGWPQKGARMVAGQAHAPGKIAEQTPDESHPPYLTVLPFVLLLGAIAVFPLWPRIAAWWDSNLHRFYAAAGLGAITLLFYLVAYRHPVPLHWPVEIVVHPAPGALQLAATLAVLANAVLNEYIPFIVLLFSLYTISGGIRIEGDLPAHPLTNTLFLAIGGLLASLIGTTGAAMLLIRPLLDTNRERKRVAHTLVFFIFIVCNCGGCLLPLGDPPLFLGYLQGVDFFWTLRLWPAWLFVNGSLLAIYYLWDSFWAYPRETVRDVRIDETRVHRLRFSGVWPNAVLLLGVVLSIAILDPAKAVPGTDWHPWLYLREIVQLLLVAVSLTAGNPAPRRQNHFNYHAIVEVAVLFLGIFITMQPALQILRVEGKSLGLSRPAHFFWATGSLSSVLDNAPTYVVFLETARSVDAQREPGDDPRAEPRMAGVTESLLAAVSLGAVFMGAMTYIGNGPNFMAKTIADHAGVRMPSFFGYLLYSFGVLLPLFVATTYLFF